jgi:large subunit ribosomal protein L20
MSRTRPGPVTRRRRNRVLKAARGYRGARSKLFRTAKQAVIRSGQYAYRDRRLRKREFRALWITRVSAACAARGVSYSRFMNGLKHACVALNRKMLSEIAIHDAKAFDKLVEVARQSAAASSAA